jgi:hypothetical protein
MMCPTLVIAQTTLDALKSIAEPFVDTTPETVILKTVEFWRHNHKPETTGPAQAQPEDGNPVLIFPPGGAPDLRFTKPTLVEVDGKAMAKSMLYWNSIMFEFVAMAAEKLSPERLRRAIVVNFIEGEGAKEKGYRFFPEARLSVQGQDANAAWKAIVALAKVLRINLHVVLAWEANDKAAYPGQSAQMTYKAV